MYDIASKRMGNHLDLVNFIREQMTVKIMQRVIFTKLENLLIKNQRMPYVLEEKGSESADKTNLDLLLYEGMSSELRFTK